MNKFNWSLLLLLLCGGNSWAQEQERPTFPPQPLPANFKNAPIYIADTSAAMEGSLYFARGDELLTFNPNSNMYTFWYTEDGTRYYDTFELANKLKMHVESKVEYLADNMYRYHYTVVAHADSPQPLRTFIMLPPGGKLGEIVMSDGWKYFYHPDKDRFMGRYRNKPWVLEAGKTAQFSLVSKSPPRYAKLESRGQTRGVKSSFSERIPDNVGALFYSENSVSGIVLAPGNTAMLPPARALQELLDYAAKYGWLPKEVIEKAHLEITKYSSNESMKLSDLLTTLSGLAGADAGEVQAMLLQIGMVEK
jgi:hypothetical protein